MIKFFLIGFFMALLFESIDTILSYIIEWIKSIISIKIAKNNAKVAKISNEIDQPAQEETRVIGFSISDNDWGEEDSNEK